jgi:formylglycine-generating enzyme required for sulfatase activity
MMASSSFINFDLQIEKDADQYKAQVIDSPAGQISTEFTLPLSDLELENFYLRVGRPRQGVRRIDSPEMETVKKVGGSLFQAVFCEEILSLLSSSQAVAQSQGKGLRIRLRFTSPELGDLPWEFLYNSRQNRFLALSQQTPLVRYLEIPQPSTSLAVGLPLKVLVMVSGPSNYPPLDVEAEYSRLNEALQPLITRNLVSLERIDNANLEALQRKLRTGKHHIFHFIGHGGFDPGTQEGILVFEDQNNLGRRLSGQELGWLLHNYPSVQLVVLNACEGARSGRQDPFAGVAQSLVQQGIPAVIAMQFEITDQAALAFSQNFYASLVDGSPVDAALSEARMSIFASGNDIEWGTPVLFTRSSDGRLFDIASYPLIPPVRPVPAPQPGEKPPDKPPVVVKPTPPPVPKKVAKNTPIWIWFAISLCLIGGVTGFACMGAYLLYLGQNNGVITSTPYFYQETATEAYPTPTSYPTQISEATPAPPMLPSQIKDDFGFPMALVPAGDFLMGSETGNPDASPSQTIYLDDYYIDVFEVTNTGYAACVTAGVCSPPEYQTSNLRPTYYADPSFIYYPVIYVNWFNAEAFCEWRGGRLPTEAEWEKAGRGTDGRTYPWGESATCAEANMVNCVGDTVQVGSYANSYSPYGLFDMSGNVWEWTADWYSADYYATLYTGAQNPSGPETGTELVIRGGSWANDQNDIRLTQRLSYDPLGVNYAIGFRCVRNP